MAAPYVKHGEVGQAAENHRLCEIQCTVVTGFEQVARADVAENHRLCEIQCTVVTGFEQVARADVAEKLGCTVEMNGRGNIVAFVPFHQVMRVRLLHMSKQCCKVARSRSTCAKQSICP